MYFNTSSTTRISCRIVMEEVGILGEEHIEWISTFKNL